MKYVLFLACFSFVIGCSSKKVKDQSAQPDAAAINNDPIGLDPEGSDGGKISGLKTVHFDFDRAVVEKGELDTLRSDADWIKKHADVKIQIEGHCDQRGSVEYNLALGERRAKAVYNMLVEMGITKGRLSTISYGEERPIAQGDSEDAYAKNRRANFVPLKMDSQPAPPLASH